jgi:addiction module HigA family antidote
MSGILHPGVYVREHIIKPRGLKVTEAASLLGVGRPALSNFLNGKASLSQDMATRLQKAFGADRAKLVQMQQDHDQAAARPEWLAVRHYIPPLFLLKARDIDGWATANHEARSQLSVLQRKLVNSSGLVLRQVDFPGYDNAERHGWDGYVEAEGANPWVPEGISGWEFGCNEDPRRKAEDDYWARVKSVPAKERRAITFVFVTPHNWPGKTAWEKEKNARGEWKAVRAFDASDLEQWLEQSLQGQIWLAEKLRRPDGGFRTLDACWYTWSSATTPTLSRELFAPAIRSYFAVYHKWLETDPGRPFIIAADSRDEALAFLACLVEQDEERTASGDLPVVLDTPDAVRRMVPVSAPFIPIVWNHEAERELASLRRDARCIIIRPRNAIDSDPDIALDLLRHEDLMAALAVMGIKGEEAERLERECAGSPTILRRRRSNFPAIREPHWAGDQKSAEELIPMAFIGAWHAASSADCAIVSSLAGSSYDEIERRVAGLRRLDDPPVWAVASYRGVASKVDALFAIAGFVTAPALNSFFKVAREVLSERDPALDLPEEDRWAADVYGKAREHSAALRAGIAETLVMLSVHGNHLFQQRMAVDVEGKVASLIRDLLQPLSLEKLLSQSADLPHYAEAAPCAFLSILKEDLDQPEPVVFGLLRPVNHPLLGGSYTRSDLLWALEGLAWNPRFLPRVIDILAQLSQHAIEDNLVNKPEDSLRGILEPLMPQTAAGLEHRKRALEWLMKEYPAVGWRLCVQQFDLDSHLIHTCYRPRWRNDASGAGQQLRGEEPRAFICKAIELALGWSQHDERTLGDLVERLRCVSDAQEETAWNLISEWAQSNPPDRAKATLRERIRSSVLTRRGVRRADKITRAKAHDAMRLLEPADPVRRHHWLLAPQWIEESVDELEDEEVDFRARDRRIHALRLSAMREIWNTAGLAGFQAVLAESTAPWVIGQLMADIVISSKDATAFVEACLNVPPRSNGKIHSCLAGFLQCTDPKRRVKFVSSLAADPDASNALALFLALPFEAPTWRLLDSQPANLRAKYWAEVNTFWANHTAEDFNELVDRLLEAQRPIAAFHAAHNAWRKIETSRLARLLRAIPSAPSETPQPHKLAPHDLSAALDELEKRPGITVEEMANFELMYLNVLDHTEHGICNLEKQIAVSPALFVQAMGFAFRRDDGQQDPPEFRIEDARRRAEIVGGAYRLLERLSRVPGTDDAGSIKLADLHAWIARARSACQALGRLEIADLKVGELLARGAPEDNGVWPCRPVCEALETVATDEVRRGFTVGARNKRGMHGRGPGGEQERELAGQYRGWADRLSFDYPFVGEALHGIADSYEHEGRYRDSEAKIRSRLRY